MGSVLLPAHVDHCSRTTLAGRRCCSSILENPALVLEYRYERWLSSRLAMSLHQAVPVAGSQQCNKQGSVQTFQGGHFQ